MSVRRLASAIACCSLVPVLAMTGPTAPPAHASADPDASARTPTHVPRQVVVRYARGTRGSERAAVRASVRGRLGRHLALPGAELLVLGRGTSVTRALARLSDHPAVRYAEANAYAQAASRCPGTLVAGAQCVPDDPRFDQQYDLDNRGQTVSGSSRSVADADIDAVEAWNISRGSSDVVVAVVDSGIAYDNPDLAPNLWRNAGELGPDADGRPRASNGVDDDGNGYVDDWRGWDVVGRSVTDPGDADNDPRDPSGHGTHVAGTIGARAHNGKGVAGLNWDVRIMNVRVRAERSNETAADIADGFAYAARNGARVVNVSLSGREYSQYLRDTITAFPDVLFVVAAGNDGLDLDKPGNDRYPCEYPSPNLVCVGATGRADELASWSNRGPRTVDVAAPGMLLIGSQPAYAPRATDTFDSDPFAAPARWLRGAAPGSVNEWGLSTTYRKSGTSLTSSTSGAVQPGSDTWVELGTPWDLRGQTGCELRAALWVSADAASGLYLQARGDADFLPASTRPAQDSPAPTGDTVAYLSGSRMASGMRVNISDLDGRPSVHVRMGMLQSPASPGTARAWVDNLALHCLSSTYSANGVPETAYMAGTSMATPHVAGVAALMLAKDPALTVAQLKRGLLEAVDVRPALTGRIRTAGRLNAYKALSASRTSVSDGVLAVAAGDGQTNRFTISQRTVAGATRLHVADAWAPWGQSPMAGSRIEPGPGCARVADTEVACAAAGITSITVDTRDLTDSVTADGVEVPVHVRQGDAVVSLPGATTGAATDVSHTAAVLHGAVTPRGEATSYRFEWGTDTTYGRSTPAADAGTDGSERPVSAALAELQPDTTYHFRLVATSAAGTAHGADATFRTAPAPPPPPEWTSPYVTAVRADGPVSHWRLGEGSGTTAADDLGANPGGYVGGVRLGVPGAVAADSAVSFAGTGGAVSIPDSPSLRTGDRFTFEAWVKLARLGAVHGLAVKGTSYMLFLDTAGRLVLRKPNVGTIAAARVGIGDTSRFHHVAATKAGPTVRLYLDGVEVTGAVTNRTVVDSSGALTLGAGAGPLNGVLDEVAVYGTPLSADAVAAHHAAAS